MINKKRSAFCAALRINDPIEEMPGNYFNSTTTTEKGGSFPFNLFPDSVIPLKGAGLILSGLSNVL